MGRFRRRSFLSQKEQTAKSKIKYLFLLPFNFLLFTYSANALPGQSTDEVVAWINANPTLRPGIGDGLQVRKNDTARVRFNFDATILPPGQLTLPRDNNTIRTETFSFFDTINGVTPGRLKEALRIIYGLDIYQDYDRAKLVYVYPTPQTIDLARRENRILLEAQQGELRLGDRYAYWMEVTQAQKGKAFNGQMTIFLREDLDKLETQLRGR